MALAIACGYTNDGFVWIRLEGGSQRTGFTDKVFCLEPDTANDFQKALAKLVKGWQRKNRPVCTIKDGVIQIIMGYTSKRDIYIEFTWKEGQYIDVGTGQAKVQLEPKLAADLNKWLPNAIKSARKAKRPEIQGQKLDIQIVR